MTEEELAAWGHHTQPETVPDEVLQVRAGVGDGLPSKLAVSN
jgi:hypothetical protein